MEEKHCCAGIIRTGCDREGKGTGQEGLASAIGIVRAGNVNVGISTGVHSQTFWDISDNHISNCRGVSSVDGHGEDGCLVQFKKGISA